MADRSISRTGEPDKCFFRSERTILINEHWYFMCRELREPEGPFSTREAAESAIERYVHLVSSPYFNPNEMSRINGLSL